MTLALIRLTGLMHFRMEESNVEVIPSTPGGFGAILADPPWHFKSWSDKGRDRCPDAMVRQKGLVERHYKTMSLDDIKALPVGDIAAKDAVLFLWAVNPMLPDALDVGRAWGFCVGHKQKILTKDLLWVEARDIHPGDQLLGFDESPVGNRRYYRPATVLSTGVEMIPSVEIEMEDGRILLASEDHPWLATGFSASGHPRQHRWVRSKELCSQRVPMLLPLLAPVQDRVETWDAGFLGGAFDGEGSIVLSKGGIRFSQNENHLMAEVKAALHRMGFEFTQYGRGGIACKQIYINGGLRNVMRFMMSCRPPRLLHKWSNKNLVASLYNLSKVEVKSIRHIGAYPCATIMTDTGTYICDGFGSHNTYKTVAFTWAKSLRKSAGWHIGLGYWTRANSEQCLLFTRGKPQKRSSSVRQLIVSPIREHSRKPDEQYQRIEELVYGPYLELFARQRREGWVSWGDQLPGTSLTHHCDAGTSTEVKQLSTQWSMPL